MCRVAKMKDSGVKWIGEIPEDWSVDKVKYHFENYKIIPGIESDKFDRLALTLKGVIKRDKEDGTGLQPKDFYTYQLLRKNDLVFKLIDLQNVSTSRIGLAHNTGIVSPAYIILHPNDVCANYAEKFFLMMWYREIFNALGDDGVRSSLNVSDLLNVAFSVPPAGEQEQIASYLDKKCSEIDSLYAEIEEQIKLLEEYKKSVITEVVSKGLNLDVEMKDSGIEWIGEIPEDWTTNRIKYLFENRKGLSITKENLIDEGLPVISYGQIHSKQNTGVSISDDLLRFVDFDYMYRSPQCKVYKYDFIFADTSEDYEGCGNCVYKRDDSILFAGYHSIILHSRIKNDNRYLAYLFKTDCWRKQLREVASGVKLFSISQKTIINSSVIIPPLEEQQQIADYLDTKCAEIDSTIADKQHQLSILEQYKKSLIYEYVTGKKEVPA